MIFISAPSGSGKTTLLSLLGGLDTPTQGEVLFDGENITAKGLEYHRRNHISLIFQSYNLIDYMTLIKNVQLTAKQDAASVLERLGLKKDEISRNVLRLSGGQQQRAAIARALASDAPVILADEPTGNLDEAVAREITTVLSESEYMFEEMRRGGDALGRGGKTGRCGAGNQKWAFLPKSPMNRRL